MSRPRIIPVLLIDKNRRVVKTRQFGQRTYIGDPFNIIRLFNEKEVDELVIVDIDASTQRYVPDIGFLRELASECFMPVAYGGGLNQVKLCETICAVGIEKLIFNTHVLDDELISAVSSSLGAQAVVGCFDYEGSGETAKLRSPRVITERNESFLSTVLRAVNYGVGEIIIQSVDRDGVRRGYDLATIEMVSTAVQVPTIALGGAGEEEHFVPALGAGASAVASGSAFCFLGSLRAVLISYPSSAFIDGLVEETGALIQ